MLCYYNGKIWKDFTIISKIFHSVIIIIKKGLYKKSMDINDCASIVAFARLLGIQGTDEEILNEFMKYYLDAHKSLKNYIIPKEVKQKRTKGINFKIDINSEDISEMIIYLGVFVLIGVIMFLSMK